MLGFWHPGETRLHLRTAQIAVSLRQAVASNARPRCIKAFEPLGNAKRPLWGSFLAPPARLELTTLRLGGARSIQVSYGGIFQDILTEYDISVKGYCRTDT